MRCKGTQLFDINAIIGFILIIMSTDEAFVLYPFDCICDKKISGSEVAGYSGKQTVF